MQDVHMLFYFLTKFSYALDLAWPRTAASLMRTDLHLVLSLADSKETICKAPPLRLWECPGVVGAANAYVCGRTWHCPLFKGTYHFL